MNKRLFFIFAIFLILTLTSNIMRAKESVEHYSTRQILTGTTFRVSVASNGTQANYRSLAPSISANGHYIAFVSFANNLVFDDSNNQDDIFVHNFSTGQTVRVSIASDGSEGNFGSYTTSISADGRYVAFLSGATNLVPNDTNGWNDVFVHDRDTDNDGIFDESGAINTSRVSIASNGSEGNSQSGSPSISADGRYVAFSSLATNLVSNDSNGRTDVFVHDRQTGQTNRVSVSTSGNEGDRNSDAARISGNGRYIAFQSRSTNLVTGDTNDTDDVFVHDTQTGHTRRVSIASDGSEADHSALDPSISFDGQLIAFRSIATNLVPSDTNGWEDTFVHNQQTGETTRVSIASNGTEGDLGGNEPSISSNGTFVAFSSRSTNLVASDTNGEVDVFVHDLQTGETSRVSVSSDGIEGDGNSNSPSISGDGSRVSFGSTASNLVAGDTNTWGDIFLHERWPVHTITGNVLSPDGNPISNVTILASGGQIATTNAAGNYMIVLSEGIYQFSAIKNGFSFSPRSLTVNVPSTSGSTFDFVGIADNSQVAPFLNLPFEYDNTQQTFSRLLQSSYDSGKVFSWFDHKYPGLGGNNGTGLWRYNYKHTQNPYWVGGIGVGVLCFDDKYCYDGHNGIDFVLLPTLARAAADGTVVATQTGCVLGDLNCGEQHGNYVVINHGNHHFTVYAHLASVTVTPGNVVTMGTPLGNVGCTGNCSGLHLHFAVYKDSATPGWDGFDIETVVDPFGWELEEPDPWVIDYGSSVSHWLWIYQLNVEMAFDGSMGTQMTDSTGIVQVTVPPNAFSGLVTLALKSAAAPNVSQQMRSGGVAFALSLLEWQPENVAQTTISESIISTPITFTINYSDSNLLHLNESQLELLRWDEVQGVWQTLPTVIDAFNNIALASTQNLGTFSFQSPLVCPSDLTEPDDNIHAAKTFTVNSNAETRLFDISEDEDWFRFEAVAGNTYILETSDLNVNVDTVLEVYSLGGSTLLASDDNSGGGQDSYLEWQAPQTGTYFARIRQANGSIHGCNAWYRFQITSQLQSSNHLYLPAVLRP